MAAKSLNNCGTSGRNDILKRIWNFNSFFHYFYPEIYNLFSKRKIFRCFAIVNIHPSIHALRTTHNLVKKKNKEQIWDFRLNVDLICTCLSVTQFVQCILHHTLQKSFCFFFFYRFRCIWYVFAYMCSVSVAVSFLFLYGFFSSLNHTYQSCLVVFSWSPKKVSWFFLCCCCEWWNESIKWFKSRWHHSYV